jgi:glyoxylate/hydroxypyruvate reductase
MALLLSPLARQSTGWRERFQAEMPELELRIWPETGDRSEVEVVACAGLPAGEFATFPHLKLVIGLLAGSERLLSDPALSPEVPIIRVADPDGDSMMNEAALLHVLRHHRNLPAYQLAQQRSEWLSLPVLRPRERRVGVMGLGPIGLAVAKCLAEFGFQVAGWARRPRDLANVEVFAGSDRLAAFLARSENVVNLLPLTPQTEGILCRETFAQMPKGASVINLGRGGHIVDADLIAALDAEHLAAATLDVFTVEPLPKESPLWRHPRITITPHCARRIDALELVPRICAAIRRLRAGEPQQQVVDRTLGY